MGRRAGVPRGAKDAASDPQHPPLDTQIVAEEWTQAELEDEVRELLYEYERHLHHARFAGARGVLKCTITGSAELAEDIIKLRFSKLANVVTAVLDRNAILSTAEAQAPGRELALIPELKSRFR